MSSSTLSLSTFVKFDVIFVDVVEVDVVKMGETLGISHNVAEEMERKRDRKERLKKYEEWQKEQEKRKLKLKDMQAR